MPKNGNRSANSKNLNVPFASNNEDIDSNVVFGDAKTKQKAKKGSAGRDVVTASGEDPPKKPDTKKLVSDVQKSFHCCQDDTKDDVGKHLPSLRIVWPKSDRKD